MEVVDAFLTSLDEDFRRAFNHKRLDATTYESWLIFFRAWLAYLGDHRGFGADAKFWFYSGSIYDECARYERRGEEWRKRLVEAVKPGAKPPEPGMPVTPPVPPDPVTPPEAKEPGPLDQVANASRYLAVGALVLGGIYVVSAFRK